MSVRSGLSFSQTRSLSSTRRQRMSGWKNSSMSWDKAAWQGTWLSGMRLHKQRGWKWNIRSSLWKRRNSYLQYLRFFMSHMVWRRSVACRCIARRRGKTHLQSCQLQRVQMNRKENHGYKSAAWLSWVQERTSYQNLKENRKEWALSLNGTL